MDEPVGEHTQTCTTPEPGRPQRMSKIPHGSASLTGIYKVPLDVYPWGPGGPSTKTALRGLPSTPLCCLPLAADRTQSTAKEVTAP